MQLARMSGDEEDAFRARDLYSWPPGAIRKIKRTFNKRVRAAGKREATTARPGV